MVNLVKLLWYLFIKKNPENLDLLDDHRAFSSLDLKTKGGYEAAAVLGTW